MPVNRYHVGDTVRVRTSTPFTDVETDAPFDPDNVIFRYLTPSGAVVVKQLSDVPSVVIQDGVGEYHIDIEVDEEGDWYYRIEGVSNDDPPIFQGADDDKRFHVNDSPFYTEE